jgi:hypothetical protein
LTKIIFIPVRDPAAPDPITTLPGATNLSEIADIEYIQKKLLTALRVPKAFLGFEEVVGDGKNLALQDIRFARTINRIQKSMLAELNKIAIVHLFLLGFEDELSNFTLGLTNPSTQADLLKIDVWKEKVLLYKDLVADPEGNLNWINLLNKVLPSIKLPITFSEKTENSYSDIDTLVYTQGVDLLERVNAKKNILKVITSTKESIKESINIPISSMVAVANQTVNNYILNLDENSKKEFFQIVSEDTKTLETKFETLRESTISKLTELQNNEDSQDMKTKISETINKIKSEKFDQLNFLKLKNLEESI